MRLKKNKQDGILVLVVQESRLDANNATQFKNELQRSITANTRAVVINIADVEFIDSTGLGAIVKGLKLVGQHTVVAVCGSREPILTMFKLTRMDKFLKLFASETAAIDFIHQNEILA
jgi:anti-sigma B factor antagonist